MKYVKHFPSHLSQLVFMDTDSYMEKISGLDYNLYLWLIYQTTKDFNDTDKLYQTYLYTDIKDSFSKKMNTQSIKDSLMKLCNVTLISNYLNSYGDKQHIKIKPFEIEIIKNDKDKSFGFSVTTNEDFIHWFDNPKPLVKVNYQIMTNIKSSMDKLLYLFLKDANGIYKNIDRIRIVDVEKLRLLLNITNSNMSHTNFLTQLKKSIKTISKLSDIDVKLKINKELNPKSGNVEIQSIKFTINYNPNKIILTQSRAFTVPTQNTIQTVDTESQSEILTFDDFIDIKVEDIVSKRSDIQNLNGFKNGIKKRLLDKDEVNISESEYSLFVELQTQKNNLKSKITNNQPHMIVLRDSEETTKEVYYINDKFELVNIFDVRDETTTQSIYDTKNEYEEKRIDGFYWDIMKCDNSEKFKWVRT